MSMKIIRYDNPPKKLEDGMYMAASIHVCPVCFQTVDISSQAFLKTYTKTEAEMLKDFENGVEWDTSDWLAEVERLLEQPCPYCGSKHRLVQLMATCIREQVEFLRIGLTFTKFEVGGLAPTSTIVFTRPVPSPLRSKIEAIVLQDSDGVSYHPFEFAQDDTLILFENLPSDKRDRMEAYEVHISLMLLEKTFLDADAESNWRVDNMREWRERYVIDKTPS